MSSQLNQNELSKIQAIADQIEEIMVSEDVFAEHLNQDVMLRLLEAEMRKIHATKFVISRTHPINGRWAVLAVAKLCDVEIAQEIIDNPEMVYELANMIGEHVENLGEQFSDAFYSDSRLDRFANVARALTLSGYKMNVDGSIVAIATVPGAQEVLNEKATAEIRKILSSPVLQLSEPPARIPVSAFAEL